MKILITGGAGFVGARLARTLLAGGTLAGRRIERLVLADLAAPPPDLHDDARVAARVEPLAATCEALRGEPFDGVFHLASAVSGECEADFDLGLRSNLDGTRALLDALRHRVQQGAAPARLVFSSSIAVFGPDPALPLPEVVGDDTIPAPQTSYGTQKLVCEHLVGEEAVCPVSPDVRHPVSSPQRTVEGLIAVYEASREAFVGRSALNLPALNVSVQQMLDALEAVAGPRVRARVRFERDERIAGIVANWPRAASARRAAGLGLQPEARFEDIIRQYIADHAGTPALKGLEA